MRRLKIGVIPVLVLSACGARRAPEAAAAPMVPEPVAATKPVAEVPPPEETVEEAAEPAPSPSNASFKATLMRADGSTSSGHVVRVERGEDFYAEEGWLDSGNAIKLTLESGSTEINVAWSEISQVAIKYGARGDIDCQYDSAFRPWMYMCVLSSTPTVKTKDGKTLPVVTRHKWRFTYDDGRTDEFYVYKLPARQQDESDQGFEGVENYGLYETLQTQLVNDAKTAITRIDITR